MNSSLNKLFCLFILVFSVFALFACQKDSDPNDDSQYSVTMVEFDSNGGSSVGAIAYNSNSVIELPENPTRTGYRFDGWFTDDVTFTNPFTTASSSELVDTELLTVYAKWTINQYIINFDVDGGTNVPSITQDYLTVVNQPADPEKEGFDFLGWFTDTLKTEAYNFSTMPAQNITLYAKWEVSLVIDNHLATETLPIHSSLYGNTNGNLNNQGLAVYDSQLDLHYYSYGSNIYSYDPASDETALVCTLISGGRATFLNIDDDVLYFIDSSNGYLLSYHLVNHVFSSISETENIYASRVQTWVNFIYPTIMYEQVYVALQRYTITNGTLSSLSYGAEHFNVEGTKVYYKPIDQVQLSVMSYNGMGKSTIVYLSQYDVEDMHETLLYDVDYDNISYFALILTVNGQLGLYTYNSVDGLVKVMDAAGGSLHSLNFDGSNLYVISGSAELYKIDIETKESEKMMTLIGNDAHIQIINYWIYIGTFEQTTLYRINPVTNEIEFLN